MYLLLLLISLIVVLGLFLNYTYSYWERRGFLHDTKASIPLGSIGAVCRREKSIGQLVTEVYGAITAPYFGIYLLFRPALLVRDLDLIHRIMEQDFNSFNERGIYVDEKNDPLSGGIFALGGHSWRTMRHRLTPAFSPIKLKGMFSVSEQVADRMVAYLNTLIPKDGIAQIDLKELLKTYAIDISGNVIFGLDVNSFENPNNKFRTIVKKVQGDTFMNAIIGIFVFLCPSVLKLLSRLGFKNPIAIRLREIIKETIEYREKNNVERKDMLQLLMQISNTGKVDEDENNWSSEYKKGQVKALSLDTITAQCFNLYITGQASTSTAAAYTIFELAQQPELLERLQQEVQETLAECNGKITYEAVNKMKFMELCLSETIRKYPSLPIVTRQCTQDYNIPCTDTVIEKGVGIIIPLMGIFYDPQYFPEPEKYDPDRYVTGNYEKKAYMPFGAGPRLCIARNMGRMNAKLAVFKILQHFNVEIMEKQKAVFENHSIVLVPKGGINVRLSRKNTFHTHTR